MKPIFTIHAGEYLVGEELERRFNKCEIWIPSKDTGTDLLITNGYDRSRSASLQVKFSKDFLPSMRPNLHSQLLACGWWTLNLEKIKNSNAEFWVLAPYSFLEKKISFVIIRPEKLHEILNKIHGDCNKLNMYLWISKDGKCFETRGLDRKAEQEIAIGDYSNVPTDRDFSEYLNNWEGINKKISQS